MRSVEVWTLSSGQGDGDYQSAVTLQSLLVSTVTKTTVSSDWMSERVWCEGTLPRVYAKHHGHLQTIGVTPAGWLQ